MRLLEQGIEVPENITRALPDCFFPHGTGSSARHQSYPAAAFIRSIPGQPAHLDPIKIPPQDRDIHPGAFPLGVQRWIQLEGDGESGHLGAWPTTRAILLSSASFLLQLSCPLWISFITPSSQTIWLKVPHMRAEGKCWLSHSPTFKRRQHTIATGLPVIELARFAEAGARHGRDVEVVLAVCASLSPGHHVAACGSMRWLVTAPSHHPS
eukprot:1158302-Pelagomonas_calceolata.AAC.8